MRRIFIIAALLAVAAAGVSAAVVTHKSLYDDGLRTAHVPN